jgi:signal transduction histidine kinase
VQSFKDVLYITEFNLYLEENDEEKFLSPEVKVNIFRIVQEQVSNIVKHANATIVNIYLTYDAGDLEIESSPGKGCVLSVTFPY